MSRWRKATKMPLLNGGSRQSRQSKTNCHRRSIVVASITSSSRDPGVGLQNHGQYQQGRSDRGVSPLAFTVETSQLLLKGLIQQFMSPLSQKDKQFRSSNPLDHLLLGVGQFDGQVPQEWSRAGSPPTAARVVMADTSVQFAVAG